MSDVKDNTKAPKTNIIKKVVANIKPALPVATAFVVGVTVGIIGSQVSKSWSTPTEFVADADAAATAE